MANNIKEGFVKKLCEFYCGYTENNDGIESLDYVTRGTAEFVYVTFEGGGQKRFSVWGDNRQGIFRDFARFLMSKEEYAWLKPEDRI